MYIFGSNFTEMPFSIHFSITLPCCIALSFSLHVQSEHFPFLSVTHSNLDLRCRTVFYIALGRLLLVELGEDEDKFERFISPMTGMCVNVLHVLVRVVPCK